ncbi:unnamed protein product, partial [Ranitomeya imitator]
SALLGVTRSRSALSYAQTLSNIPDTQVGVCDWSRKAANENAKEQRVGYFLGNILAFKVVKN